MAKPFTEENHIFSIIIIVPMKVYELVISHRGGETGCAGCVIAHPIFALIEAFTSFQGKKNFQIRSKIDQDRSKNANCALNI